MIWKEDDLVDILKTDNSIYKVCRNNEYYFDLQQEVKLECITIQLKNNFSLENIQYSNDSKNFNCFEKKHLIIQDNIITLVLSEEIPIRYLKIKDILNCKLLIRKYRGIFIASPSSYYGDRFIALLNAIYLSNKIGFKHGFAWMSIQHKHNHCDTYHIEPEEYIFSREYLKRYSYTSQPDVKFKIGVFPKYAHMIELSQKPFMEKFGFYTNHGNLRWFIKDVPESYLVEYPKLWKSIEFSEHIQKVMDQSREIFLKNFNCNIVCIHIRSGDIVYGDKRDLNFLNFNKATPVEIVLEIIKRNIHVDILIVGEDRDTIFKLIQYVRKKYCKFNIYDSASFVPSNINNKTDLDFFELTFISSCKKIYSFSGFARLASMIGNGIEPERWDNIFTNDEKFDIISRNINNIDVSSYQKAFSFFVMFYYAKILKKNIEILIDILEKAFENDKENKIFVLLLVECYIIDNEYEKAENMVCQNYSIRFISILKFYKNRWYFDSNIDEKCIYKFPYLCSFLAIKHYYKGNFEKFIYFAFYYNGFNSLLFFDFLEDFRFENKQLPFISNFKHGTAKTRIQNQLSYKLGQAMIVNSKSILGYIRMPFVLSYIKDKHKQEQKIYKEKIKKDPSLKLPPLEDYPDYKEALKLKNHLSYKLGQALIQANKTWYKGGYVKMWFEIGRLKKEVKKNE
ncbi:hypothetical protein O8I71_07585 [Campylobacter lari]|uniref:hypothetical protein n=1 Tax=Campylobacter lari TaxID=201 RepID=UPI0037269F97